MSHHELRDKEGEVEKRSTRTGQPARLLAGAQRHMFMKAAPLLLLLLPVFLVALSI